MMKEPAIYIVSNIARTVLYIGVTSDLELRILQHKSGVGSIFTSKYNCVDLLHYEKLPSMNDAIAREKQMKKWNREWKINLIKELNPDLNDIAADWYEDEQIENCRIEFARRIKEN